MIKLRKTIQMINKLIKNIYYFIFSFVHLFFKHNNVYKKTWNKNEVILLGTVISNGKIFFYKNKREKFRISTAARGNLTAGSCF